MLHVALLLANDGYVRRAFLSGSPVLPLSGSAYGGYALDAIDWYDPQNQGKSHKGDVMAFLKDSLTATPENRPALGKGIDYRFSSEKVTGFALCLDEQVLHLSVFAKPDGTGRAARGSRMVRSSRRVGYRL